MCTPRSVTRTLAPGDCVWVQADKYRPAIVVRKMPARDGDPDQSDRWLVVVGTGTQRQEACLAIGPNSHTGRVLGLSKPTYFYRGGVSFPREAAVTSNCGRCLPSELYRVEEIIGDRPPSPKISQVLPVSRSDSTPLAQSLSGDSGSAIENGRIRSAASVHRSTFWARSPAARKRRAEAAFMGKAPQQNRVERLRNIQSADARQIEQRRRVRDHDHVSEASSERKSSAS